MGEPEPRAVVATRLDHGGRCYSDTMLGRRSPRNIFSTMATIRAAAAPEKDESAVGARGPRSGRSRAGVYGLLVVLVLVPLVVTLIALIGTHWHPSSDDAIEVLRIRDVGGRHTPLTGAPSRFGWDHPGPSLFWILAPFRWVAGHTGVLVGVVCIN